MIQFWYKYKYPEYWSTGTEFGVENKKTHSVVI